MNKDKSLSGMDSDKTPDPTPEQLAIMKNYFYRPQHIYRIDSSDDKGKTWKHEASFIEDETPNRFGNEKMNDELILKEGESFRQHHEGRRSNLTDVRLIIQMKIKTDER